MKTIEVTDEQFELMQEFQRLLKTQDNRCTRAPFYVVHEKKKQWGMDLEFSDNMAWCFDTDTYDDDELKEYIIENYPEETLKYAAEDDMYEVEESEDLDEYEKASEYIESLDMWDFEDFVKAILKDAYKVYWEYKTEVASNCFSFFEKDSYEHINLNGHNLSQPSTYAYSLQRTPKMEALRSLLLVIDLGAGK